MLHFVHAQPLIRPKSLSWVALFQHWTTLALFTSVLGSVSIVDPQYLSLVIVASAIYVDSAPFLDLEIGLLHLVHVIVTF